MKKFLSLLLALILGLFSTTVATKTVQTNPIDTPTETKIVEWAIGYGKRCKGYCGKVQPRNWQPVKRFARRVALAPLCLFIGIASAEGTEPEIRKSSKAEKREKAPGFSCKTFQEAELWRNYEDEAEAIRSYYPQENEDPSLRGRYATRAENLLNSILATGLTVRVQKGRTIRLTKGAIPEVTHIDYESKKPTTKIMVVEHNIQSVFDFHWSLFSNDKKIGEQLKDKYQKRIEKHLMYRGVKVLYKDGTFKLYGGAASSSSHQKQEKLLMVDAQLMKANEKFFWFGKSLAEFVSTTRMMGAEFWKIRANLIRPWMKQFVTADEYVIRMKDVLFVKDVEKIYIVKNGRRIGKINGKLYRDGVDKEPKVLGDGAIVSLVKLAFQGQCSSTGLKGFFVDGTSSIEALCKKHGMTVKEFMNLEVMGIDGKLHRIGDYKAIAGEGCWKFDKAFDKFEDYMNWLADMEKSYPGIDALYLLRQSEEIEEEDKIRRLTKTLIQQWMMMNPKEIRRLTAKVRKDLRKAKTFKGSVRKLAALWKTPEERTAVEKLFEEAPWLIANPIIQEFLKEKWYRKLIEAASCKFRTEGQYPYIMQDTVALLECWVLGLDPNSEDLGILKDDEVSCADVPDGRELLCVRFPANFLTAMVMINRACAEAFSSVNAVMMLSVHSDILIRQDGDVDGDEMCVIYNRLAIAMTKRMLKEFNPPVILFMHGGKPERHRYDSVEAFIEDCSDALWRAKKYDSVGLYANLAMKCAYLAAIAHAKGNKRDCDKYLLWMSAASTGAILAIDQVKGNAVDESLINWLDTINKNVRSAIKDVATEMGCGKLEASMKQNPFTHYYNEMAKRRPIDMATCLGVNELNFVDMISDLILRDAGSWDEYDMQGVEWNAIAACDALLDHSMPLDMKVKYGCVTKEMVELLGDNWFKLESKDKEMDKTIETRKKMVPGTQIGLKEFLLMLWRNESSMAYSMEGTNLYEKKEEYYGTCRELLRMFLESGDWVNKYAKSFPEGYEFSLEERWTIMVNAVIADALELRKGNGLDKNKGSYAMFCLRLFAPELRKNVSENRVDKARFFLLTMSIDDLLRDIDEERMEDLEELMETAPEPVEEIPEPQYEEPPMDEGYIEYLLSQCPPPEDDECIGIIE